MARIRLIAPDAERSYDTGLGRFTDGEAIPCFRCGVCCRRWQPLIGPVEAQRLAEYLGLETRAFVARYARAFPFSDDEFQLNEVDGGCVFLCFEDGLAACSVHEARPQACRDWDASLRRKECLDGLATPAGTGPGLVAPPAYENPADAAAFRAHLRTKQGYATDRVRQGARRG